MKARKLNYYGHIMHSEGDSLEKNINTGAIRGSRKCAGYKMWKTG